MNIQLFVRFQKLYILLQVKGNPDKVVVEGQTQPGSQTTDIVYPDATPEQINVLTKQSGFCSQVKEAAYSF